MWQRTFVLGRLEVRGRLMTTAPLYFVTALPIAVGPNAARASTMDTRSSCSAETAVNSCRSGHAGVGSRQRAGGLTAAKVGRREVDSGSLFVGGDAGCSMFHEHRSS